MKISIIGAGYVGLVTGSCLSEFGYKVVCIDKDKDKINNLNKCKIPIFEPGLENIIEKNLNKNIFFSTDLKDNIQNSDFVFIAVGTPEVRGEGAADLSNVFACIDEIVDYLQDNVVIISKSTVPVGTSKKIKAMVNNKRSELNFHVVSNPEFLREGSAIEDFMRPNRIIVGYETLYAKTMMEELYRPFYLNKSPIVFTSLETSEMIKYVSNAFLATKIAFINEISNLAEKVNADIQDISYGIGLDPRIGKYFLHTSPGFGGSCFPKDLKALDHTAKQHNTKLSIVESVIESNKTRVENMSERIIKIINKPSLHGVVIAVLGLTFKPNTDDLRDSPSLTIIPKLIAKGAKINCFDPKANYSELSFYNSVFCFRNIYEAISGATSLVILTEWNEFRALDCQKVKSIMKENIVIDLRNIYNPDVMQKLGFNYYSLGRKNAA